MPYSINRTNGTLITTVQDGTLNATSLDITLIGKNYSGYGETFNENFVKLLENFANSSPPKKPLQGELWYDIATKRLRVYEPTSKSTLNGVGTSWKPLGTLESGPNKPAGYMAGDLWYNTFEKALYAYTGVGTDWVKVGPLVSRAAVSGAIESAVTDTTNIAQPVVKVVVNGLDSFISSSLEFDVSTTDDVRPKFSIIKEGITLPNTDQNGVSVTDAGSKTGSLFWGTAGSALGLVRASTGAFITADQYLTRSEIASLSGQIITSSDDGVLLGAQGVLKLHVTNPSIGNVSVVNGFTLKLNVRKDTSSTYNVITLTSTGTNSLPKLLPSAENVDTYIGFTGANQQFAYGYINTISGVSISLTTASITTVSASVINAPTFNGSTISGTTASITTVTAPTLNSTRGNISTVNATTGNITTINATTIAATSATFSGNVTDNNNRVITQITFNAGTGLSGGGTVNGPSGTINFTNTGILSITGTSNQVNVSGTQDLTLSLPQSIHSGASPTFNGLTLSSLSAAAGGSTVYGAWSLAAGATFQATYADLAERYAADAIYKPGTVLVIGGEKEVTVTTRHGDTARAGIVSTAPAYTLNAKAGDDDTHPYIALAGRVPCKVVGPIMKGDLLVTSTKPGYAERAFANDNPNAVIGRALETFEGKEGVIEVMVV